MIDPEDPLDVQVDKQAQIIAALIRRAERRHEVGESAYSLFQSAISLQTEIWRKTRDLEEALDSLGQTARDLDAARRSQEVLQKNLADAMIAMEGGFALFSDGQLEVCNTLFRRLLPDVEPSVRPGMKLDAYLAAIRRSAFVDHDPGEEVGMLAPEQFGNTGKRFTSSILALKNDRWFQVSQHRTSSDNIVLLQTEVTDIVRENRRQKEKLIDRQGEFLQAAFDHVAIGIATFSATGELLVRNDRFGDLLGVPLRLLRQGTPIRRILAHLDRFDLIDADGAQGRTLAAMLRGKPAQGRFRRSDGISLDLRASPVPEGGYVVTIMDVTAEADAAAALERRVVERTAELTEANRLLELKTDQQARAEDALRDAKEAAECANRSKARFIASASHDLLQPINAAKLYISSLQDHDLPGPSADTVQRLSRSFTSIEALLQSILDMSRLDSPDMDLKVSSFGMGPVLQTIAEDFAHMAREKGVELRVVPSSRWVTSDRRYLFRSVQNLVVNAIQYTTTGKVLVGCRRRGDAVVVEVHDTGAGISDIDQTRIFKEFTRGSDPGAGSGVGLGLSIVERACRHLGHPLHLNSAPGRGSCFAITLPCARDSHDVQHFPNGAMPSQDVGPGLIVMVVENDADVLHATTAKLESWGISVVAVTSTTEACSVMRDLGTAPDIVLADYQLDGPDSGLDAIRALRDLAGQEIPAVLITANTGKPVMRRAEDMSVPVLQKPVQLARLRSLIDWTTRGRVA